MDADVSEIATEAWLEVRPRVGRQRLALTSIGRDHGLHSACRLRRAISLRLDEIVFLLALHRFGGLFFRFARSRRPLYRLRLLLVLRFLRLRGRPLYRLRLLLILRLLRFRRSPLSPRV